MAVWWPHWSSKPACRAKSSVGGFDSHTFPPSSDVLNQAVTQLASLRGSTPGVVEITSYEVGSREVDLSGGDLLDDGGIYYVGAMDRMTGNFAAVDDDLGRPLRLRVEHHFFGGSTGWLLSEPAEYEHVTGSTLSKSPLTTQLSSE